MNEERSKVLPFPRRRARDPKRVADFREMARQLRVERESSEEVVARVLRETPPDQWPALVSDPELRTCGVLERFSREIDRRLDLDPLEALTLARVCTAIAGTLDEDHYPPITRAQIQATAWKDLGQAQCYLGRYDDALQSLDAALAGLAPHGSLAHDRAIIKFVRATVLQHLRRFDEAEALLAECGVVFRSYGDTRLYAKCTLAHGNLHVRRGDHRAARMVLTPLLTGEPDIVPLARMALGWCAIHEGQADIALIHFNESARGCRRLGRELEAVRADYGASSALLHLGRFEDAISQFRVARYRFLKRGLVEEAGLSGLGIIEAYLVLQAVPEARTLAQTLVQEFSRAGLNRRAVAALAYLNDAIAASSATPEVVRTVHAYVDALRTDPTREFALAN
jgi:tetratricopeptide (TPR) repeat protein